MQRERKIVGIKICEAKANFSISDTGEHVQLEDNSLKYIPFPICNETGRPLELKYGVEEGLFYFFLPSW